MSFRCFALVIATLPVACSDAPAPPQPTAAATVAPLTSAEVTGTVPPNAIVALIPAAAPVPMPDGPAVMDQYAKQFVPNVLYVRVGQAVEFRNSEDMPHNVTVKRRTTGAEVFNVGTEPHQKHVHTFDRVGQFDVTCDIHPGMQATLIAAESPMVTVAEDNGRFSIANVKPGAYKLTVTFEGRTVEQSVDVSAARVDVLVKS